MSPWEINGKLWEFADDWRLATLNVIWWRLWMQRRTVVVREPTGVLRFATPEERDRAIQVYFPRPSKMYAMPKMFTEQHLEVRRSFVLVNCFSHTHKKSRSYNIVHYRQYLASIAAAEKRPLSYQTPQSVHRVWNCGDQTLPLTMHYGGETLGENWGWNGLI